MILLMIDAGDYKLRVPLSEKGIELAYAFLDLLKEILKE